MIGDPSGRSAERQLLTLEIIRENARAVGAQLARFVDFTGDTAAVMVNNADWTTPVSYLDFLRDIGKHFTVNYMIGQGIRPPAPGGSGARHFLHRIQLHAASGFRFSTASPSPRLHHAGRRHDQWGNITAGIELIRRVRGAQAFGITFPLLATSTR